MLTAHRDDVFSRITNYLIQDLKNFEKDIQAAYKNKSIFNGKKNLYKEYEKKYEKELKKTQSKLANISLALFLDTQIDLVRYYKPGKKIPENFQEYSNAATNLINLVKLDICTKHDSNALTSMERWIYLVKLCHENHDCFSASSIFLGLFSLEHNKADLFIQLSPKTKIVYDYYKNLYSSLNKIHIVQVKLYKTLCKKSHDGRIFLADGEIFIPLLMVLGNITHTIKEAAELDEQDPNIQENIKIYRLIQRALGRLKGTYYLNNSTETESYGKILRLAPEEYKVDDIINSFVKKKDSDSKAKVKTAKQPIAHLYTKEDKYYALKQKLVDYMDLLKILVGDNKKYIPITDYLREENPEKLVSLLKQEKSLGLPKNIYVTALKGLKILKELNKDRYEKKQNQVDPKIRSHAIELTNEEELIPVNEVKENKNTTTTTTTTTTTPTPTLAKEESVNSEKETLSFQESAAVINNKVKPSPVIQINDEKEVKEEKKVAPVSSGKSASPRLPRTKTPLPSNCSLRTISLSTAIFTPNYSPRPKEQEEKEAEKRRLKRKFQRPPAGSVVQQKTLSAIEEKDESIEEKDGQHSHGVATGWHSRFSIESSQELTDSNFSLQESDSELSELSVSLDMQFVQPKPIEKKEEISKRMRSQSTPIKSNFTREKSSSNLGTQVSPQVNAVLTPRENSKVSEIVRQFENRSKSFSQSSPRLFPMQNPNLGMEAQKKKTDHQTEKPAISIKPE